MRKAEARLLAILEEDEMKSSTVTEEGVTYTVSATSRTTTSYNEEGLKKALGAKQFSRLTTAKLDKTKLEKAVEQGDVDVHVVAQHVTISPGARSLRLTRKVAEDSEAPAT